MSRRSPNPAEHTKFAIQQITTMGLQRRALEAICAALLNKLEAHLVAGGLPRTCDNLSGSSGAPGGLLGAQHGHGLATALGPAAAGTLQPLLNDVLGTGFHRAGADG